MKRAETFEEIKPLIELCKTGRLFDVQEWISEGKPLNPPPHEKGNRRKNPFEIAIDLGFHSLVQVLLEGGAASDKSHYNPMEHALDKRRLDLVKLLVAHGISIHSVDMVWVFDTWNPKIMEYFIENGADVETGYPLAWAFIGRVRSTLGVFKRHKCRFPSFQEQVNMALRYHCRDGNLKWVSLMLWAGGDPYARGPVVPDEERDPEEEYWNALELAIFHEHFEILRLKQIRLDPNRPDSLSLLKMARYSGKADFLKELLDKGFNPIDRKNGGSSLIQSILQSMGWGLDINPFEDDRKKNIDTSRTREKIKMIHMLAKQGAKWVPGNRSEIAEARRALLRLSPDYTVEFIWIMSKFNACPRENIEELIRTPAIRTLVSEHLPRINELIKTFYNTDNTKSKCCEIIEYALSLGFS